LSAPKRPIDWPFHLGMAAACVVVGLFCFVIGVAVHQANEEGAERKARANSWIEHCDDVPYQDYQGCLHRERLRYESSVE